jgi:hypothetical protein
VCFLVPSSLTSVFCAQEEGNSLFDKYTFTTFKDSSVRFEVLMAMTMKNVVFWDI